MEVELTQLSVFTFLGAFNTSLGVVGSFLAQNQTLIKSGVRSMA